MEEKTNKQTNKKPAWNLLIKKQRKTLIGKLLQSSDLFSNKVPWNAVLSEPLSDVPSYIKIKIYFWKDS